MLVFSLACQHNFHFHELTSLQLNFNKNLKMVLIIVARQIHSWYRSMRCAPYSDKKKKAKQSKGSLIWLVLCMNASSSIRSNRSIVWSVCVSVCLITFYIRHNAINLLSYRTNAIILSLCAFLLTSCVKIWAKFQFIKTLKLDSHVSKSRKQIFLYRLQ